MVRDSGGGGGRVKLEFGGLPNSKSPREERGVSLGDLRDLDDRRNLGVRGYIHYEDRTLRVRPYLIGPGRGLSQTSRGPTGSEETQARTGDLLID